MSSLALIVDGDKPNIAIEGNSVPIPSSNEASVKESLLTLKQKVLCIVRSGRKDNPNVHVLTFDSNGKSKLNFIRITKKLLQDEPKDSELNTASILDLADTTGNKIIPGFFNQGVEVGWDVSEWDPFKADPGKFVIKFYSNIDLDGVTDEINTEMGLEEFLKLFSDENINRTLVRIERVVPGQKNPEAYAALRIPSGRVNSEGVGLDLLLLLTDKASLERHLFKVNDRTVASDARDKMAEILSQLRSLNPLLNAQIQKEIKLMEIPISGNFIKSIEEMRLWSKYFSAKEGKYYERLQGIKKPLARVLTHMVGMLIGKGKIESSRLDFSNVTNTKPRKESSVFQIESPEQKAIEAPKEKEVTLNYVWGVSVGGDGAVIAETKPSEDKLNLLVCEGERLKYYSIRDSSFAEDGVPSIFNIEAEEDLEGAFVLSNYNQGKKYGVSWSRKALRVSPLDAESSSITLRDLVYDLPSEIKRLPDMLDDEIIEVVEFDRHNDDNGGVSKGYTTNENGRPIVDDRGGYTFFDVAPYLIVHTKNGYSYKVCYLGSSDVINMQNFPKYLYRQTTTTNVGYKDLFVVRKKPGNRICLSGFEESDKNTFFIKNPVPLIRNDGKSISIAWQASKAEYRMRSPAEVSVISSANGQGDYYTYLGRYISGGIMPRFFFIGTKAGEFTVHIDPLGQGFKPDNILFNLKPFNGPITDIVSVKYMHSDSSYQHLVLVSSSEEGKAILYLMDSKQKTIKELDKITLPVGTRVLNIFRSNSKDRKREDKPKDYFMLLTETNGVLVNNRVSVGL